MICVDLISQAQVPGPDSYFWYVFASVLASLLIIMIGWFLQRTVKIQDVTTATLNEVKTMVALHEKEIQNHKQEIDNIKEKIFNR